MKIGDSNYSLTCKLTSKFEIPKALMLGVQVTVNEADKLLQSGGFDTMVQSSIDGFTTISQHIKTNKDGQPELEIVMAAYYSNRVFITLTINQRSQHITVIGNNESE